MLPLQALLVLRTVAPWPLLDGFARGPAANRTQLFLQEQGALYLHAAQRCRGPAAGEAVPTLQLVASWGQPGGGAASSSSRDGSSSPEAGITLATQLSLDRLDELELQCQSWPHALVAAVYVPLVRSRISAPDSPGLDGAAIAVAQKQLGQFHDQLQLAQGGW